MNQQDEARLQSYCDRFDRARQAVNRQAKRERDALRFQVPDKQWTDSAKAEREGALIGNVPIPPRPTLSVSQLAQPLRIITNQQRQADLGVNIHPISADANEETAEFKQGLYRHIERESIASDARDWAFDRGVKAGRGFWRVGTKFDPAAAPDSPESFDQVITIKRIYYQDQVYFDPSAIEADLSDAEYVFISSWVPIGTFKRQWPKAQLPDEDAKFTNPYRSAPDWTKGEGENLAVLVCEQYSKVHTPETISLVEVEGQQLVMAGEVPANGKVLASRQRDRVSIKWCTFTAVDILDEEDFPGELLPVVPFLGEELQPFDDDRRFMGVIEPNMDAQRFYNFAASTAVERMALEPKAPFQVTPEQIKGWENWYQNANRRNLPYLPYNPVAGPDGQPIGPPSRTQVDASGTSLAMMALQQAKDFLQSGTFIYDPSLGRPQRSSKSGIAIEREQSQADAANSNYLLNFARAMECEARIVLGMMPFVYDRKGRVVRTLSAEDETQAAMVNQRFVNDPSTGEPLALDEGETAPEELNEHFYDLSKGYYDVSVTIGRSYQTQMQQAATEIGDILQSDPSLMPLIGATYFHNRDFPGAKEIAKIMRKVRDQQFPGIMDDAPPAEKAQAENQQLKAQLQQMGQAMQEMQQALATDQAKQQATIAKAQIDGQTNLQKAQIDNEAKVTVAAQSNEKDREIAELKAKVDLILKAMDLQDKTHDRAHERGMQAEDHKNADLQMLANPKPIKPLKEPLQKDREVRK